MSSVMSPASADEALEMLTVRDGVPGGGRCHRDDGGGAGPVPAGAGAGHLAGTAARTSVLSAFASGQGYSADADYSPRAWLIHKTGVTKGAAVAYTA